MTSVRHAHTVGHLAPGGERRCGCEPARTASRPAPRWFAGQPSWVPIRRQHAAFVRAHFIYSDRMVRLGA
ncbi:hypothetical protein QE377_002386 [Microbacterium sp. SORGH_AS 862]|nr:hypothetical protein [Microbacterium sp. SORGH_AS_0862]